jgi:hypothetical protein
MRKRSGAYRVLVRKPEGNMTLGRLGIGGKMMLKCMGK